jgi:hypothetical protein
MIILSRQSYIETKLAINHFLQVGKTFFSPSVWMRPKVGHSGTILAKVLNTKDMPYRLMIDTNGNVTLRIELLVTGHHTLTVSKSFQLMLLFRQYK